MFLKRDWGSPLNCAEVDAVLEAHQVLPLNSPPGYPRYNGSMERGMRDLHDALDERLLNSLNVPLGVEVELATHQLNHRVLRSLGQRTPCQVYHDPQRRLKLHELPAREYSVKCSSSSGIVSNVCPFGTNTPSEPCGVWSSKPGSAARAGSPSRQKLKPLCQPIPIPFSLTISFALQQYQRRLQNTRKGRWLLLQEKVDA